MAEGSTSGKSKFKCSSCKNGWNSIRSLSLPEKCGECKNECNHIKYRPGDHLEQKLGDKMEMVAKYKCFRCTKKWKSYKSSGGPKACPMCSEPDIKPYRYLSSTKVKPQCPQVPRRQFGSFSCPCGNQWKSANAWEGKYQECRCCRRQRLPYSLTPLLYSGGSFGQTPHEESLCEMCKTLGRSCKEYIPRAPQVTSFLEDDGESIISLTSTDSGGTRRGYNDDDDHYRTPVASDDEDFLLADGVEKLTL